MSDETEANLAERLFALEKTAEEQRAQISALEGVLSILLVSQTVCHSDMQPAKLLAEYRDCDWKRGFEGGTSRISAEYFYVRGEQYQAVLEGGADRSIATRYWKRSALPWLDNRRYERLTAVADRFARLADVSAPAAPIGDSEGN